MDGLITFHIIEAELPEGCKANCRLELNGKNVSKSRASPESDKPKFNYHTSVLVEPEDKLVLQIQKKKLLGHGLVGEAVVPKLEEKEEMEEMWLDLKPAGRVRVRYHFLGRQDKVETDSDCLKHLIIGVECADNTVLRLDPDLTMISYGKQKKPERMLTCDIRDVRDGHIGCKASKDDHGHAFTIIYGHHYESWVMKAKTPEEREIILRALEQVNSKVMNRMFRDASLRLWKRHEWLKADKNSDNVLSLKEVTRLMNAINFTSDKKEVVAMFAGADRNNDDDIDYNEFSDMCNKLFLSDDIRTIFTKYSSDGEMSAAQFAQFLKEEQKEDASEERAVNLIKKHVAMFGLINSEMRLTPETMAAATSEATKFDAMEFQSYLESSDASAYNPQSTVFVEDSMYSPLSHYFINSSHNTYLMGDQLKDDSSVEAYVRALQQGCRCVEMDCWDGDDDYDHEPVIFHGHTLTSKILFKDALRAIKKYAFEASDYPVLLSIENHCTHDQQVKMARHLKEILADYLYYVPHPEDEPSLPSPAFFKNKFLVKGKKLKPPAADSAKAGETVSSESSESETEGSKGKGVKTPKPKMAEELSDLVTHMQGVHFKDFATSASEGKCYNMSSFGESKTKKLSSENRLGWIKYNTRQLSRTYPGGTRVDSSNYDPTMAFRAGCQIVALNFQTADGPFQVNSAFYKQNGGSGYVLKPEFMRSKNPTLAHGKMKITIRVINGSRIPKPTGDDSKSEVVDPIVKIYLHNGEDDDDIPTYKTAVKSQGLNPRWDETTDFTLENSLWPTSVLRFIVRDEDLGSDDFIGYWACPTNQLMQGYRMLPLSADNGFPLLHSYLFVHIAVEELA